MEAGGLDALTPRAAGYLPSGCPVPELTVETGKANARLLENLAIRRMIRAIDLAWGRRELDALPAISQRVSKSVWVLLQSGRWDHSVWPDLVCLMLLPILDLARFGSARPSNVEVAQRIHTATLARCLPLAVLQAVACHAADRLHMLRRKLRLRLGRHEPQMQPPAASAAAASSSASHSELPLGTTMAPPRPLLSSSSDSRRGSGSTRTLMSVKEGVECTLSDTSPAVPAATGDDSAWLNELVPPAPRSRSRTAEDTRGGLTLGGIQSPRTIIMDARIARPKRQRDLPLGPGAAPAVEADSPSSESWRSSLLSARGGAGLSSIDEFHRPMEGLPLRPALLSTSSAAISLASAATPQLMSASMLIGDSSRWRRASDSMLPRSALDQLATAAIAEAGVAATTRPRAPPAVPAVVRGSISLVEAQAAADKDIASIADDLAGAFTAISLLCGTFAGGMSLLVRPPSDPLVDAEASIVSPTSLAASASTLPPQDSSASASGIPKRIRLTGSSQSQPEAGSRSTPFEEIRNHALRAVARLVNLCGRDLPDLAQIALDSTDGPLAVRHHAPPCPASPIDSAAPPELPEDEILRCISDLPQPSPTAALHQVLSASVRDTLATASSIPDPRKGLFVIELLGWRALRFVTSIHSLARSPGQGIDFNAEGRAITTSATDASEADDGVELTSVHDAIASLERVFPGRFSAAEQSRLAPSFLSKLVVCDLLMRMRLPPSM